LREAGRDLLEQRRVCYEQQADNHADIADNLTKSAGMWEQHEAAAAEKLERISDDGR
jgi:Excreted virulence factor EspC, type VII ESX diderm